uniref:Retrotransposon Copia-like N-terminal domain-containing protein n=1 Tax=Populus alba TaxID=43335 RepID=A0A4U5PNC7_POPAL|nr:hypothetical protein D5086_0000200440 [Populus alba]
MASRGLENIEGSIAPSSFNQHLYSDLNIPDMNSNQRLCSVQLNEFNYLPWSRAVSLALGGRSKIEFIDKSIAAPDVNSLQYKSWFANAATLLKRAEEDKIFQLLANLSHDYEDLRSRILMNSELPSFANVCATIQREETRRKVMNLSSKSDFSEARAFVSHQRRYEEKGYKSRRSDLKCNHCNNLGHSVERCWDLHPELNQSFQETAREDISLFNHQVDIINEFASYLHAKQGAKQNGGDLEENKDSSALIGQFAGFLAANKNVSALDLPGILNAFSSALIEESSSALFPLPTPVVEAYCPEQSHCNAGMDIHTDPISVATEGADLQVEHQEHLHPSSRRNPIRNRKPSSRLHDYVTYTVKHPVTNALAYHRLSSSFGAYLSTITKATEPSLFLGDIAGM